MRSSWATPVINRSQVIVTVDNVFQGIYHHPIRGVRAASRLKNSVPPSIIDKPHHRIDIGRIIFGERLPHIFSDLITIL